jgi:hypothetical protein
MHGNSREWSNGHLFSLMMIHVPSRIWISLRCTNHIFIYQIHIEKKYKTSKHTNKLYILYKHVIKIKIFKMNLNKKWVVLLTWCGEF